MTESQKRSAESAIVALGSNLGDSRRTIREAIKRLESLSDKSLLTASLWETEPVDCPPGTPSFINSVVALAPRPGETPESLLEKLLQLEEEFGRPRERDRNEARTLDLDLIAFGSAIRSSPKLRVPHPRARERRFVLAPLAEILPDLVLPNECLSVRKLLDQLTPEPPVNRLEAV